MRRISNETFCKTKYDPDKVVGIRVKDGEFYFLAWMENSEDYRIQAASDPNGYLIERDALIVDMLYNRDIYYAVHNCSNYDRMLNLWVSGDENKEENAGFANEYAKFLSLIKPYVKNGESDPEDHDIFVLTAIELSQICDVLRDGDYVFVILDE